jgi:hypothetical protein
MLLLWQSGLQALPGFDAANPGKHCLYEIWDSLAAAGGRFPGTANLKGWWWDADEPTFDESATGTGDLTVTLPRLYGDMGGEDENNPNHATTLVRGYVVKIYVIDADTLAETDPDDQRRLIYTGTIEETSPSSDSGTVTVTVMALGRIAEQTYFPTDTALTSTTIIDAAHDIVIDYLPGLDWDTNNPSVLSGPALPAGFKGEQDEPVIEALRRLAAAWGPDVFVYVTPTATVRFFQQDRELTGREGASGSARHTLVKGTTFLHDTLNESDKNKINRVIVKYATGRVVDDAADYDAEDPRTQVYNFPDVTDATAAADLAAAILADVNRTRMRATGYVPEGCGIDIENLLIGDTVRLLVPADMSDGFSFHDIVIMQRSYSLWGVKLELDQPQPRLGAQQLSLLRRVREVERRTVDSGLKRGSSTLLSAEDSALKAAGLVSSGDPAGTASAVTISNVHDTSASADGSLKVRVGTTTMYIPLSAVPV